MSQRSGWKCIKIVERVKEGVDRVREIIKKVREGVDTIREDVNGVGPW